MHHVWLTIIILWRLALLLLLTIPIALLWLLLITTLLTTLVVTIAAITTLRLTTLGWASLWSRSIVSWRNSNEDDNWRMWEIIKLGFYQLHIHMGVNPGEQGTWPSLFAMLETQYEMSPSLIGQECKYVRKRTAMLKSHMCFWPIYVHC